MSARTRPLLLLAALLLCGPGCKASRGTAADASGDDVRAMSFNIRYGTASDGANAWPLRRDLTFRVIHAFAPDVLGVQEALRFQLDEIAREFPQYAEVGVGRDDGEEAGEYSAILYKADRLEVIESGTFWLSDQPETPGSMSWGNRIPRIATWARFRDRIDGSAWHVYNTHWDHESQPSRVRSAMLILDHIRAATELSGGAAGRADAAEPSGRTAGRAPGVGVRSPTDGSDVSTGPVILMGDFNAGEDNDAFRALLADPVLRLVDVFRAVHPDAGETGTFNAFRGDRSGPRIDAVFASPHWMVHDADIVRLSDAGRYPSDHFPVTAVLRLGTGRR